VSCSHRGLGEWEEGLDRGCLGGVVTLPLSYLYGQRGEDGLTPSLSQSRVNVIKIARISCHINFEFLHLS